MFIYASITRILEKETWLLETFCMGRSQVSAWHEIACNKYWLLEWIKESMTEWKKIDSDL